MRGGRWLAALALFASACCCGAGSGDDADESPPRASEEETMPATSSRGSFRQRLQQRVDAFVAHPRVRVEVLYVGEGTDPAVLDAIEAERGLPLPVEIRAFYEDVGRVQVMWRCLPPGSPADAHRPANQLADGWLPDRPHHGIVDIGTADEVFRTGDYTDDLWFPGDEELNAIEVDGRPAHRRHLRRFDNVDHYTQFALLVEPDVARIPVIIGGDYFADADGPSIPFARYLDMVVDHLGYQGDTHDGLCAGVEDELRVSDPYGRQTALYLEYTR